MSVSIGEEILQRSHDMEYPEPSQRATTVGSDDGPPTIRDGLGVDDKRNINQFIEAHQDVNRFKLVTLSLTADNTLH